MTDLLLESQANNVLSQDATSDILKESRINFYLQPTWRLYKM